jgi:hypothetical protein
MQYRIRRRHVVVLAGVVTAAWCAWCATTSPLWADDPQQTNLQNARADVTALESAVRHVEGSVAALYQQDQRDIAMLADKLGWWQDCYTGKIEGCWEWLSSSRPH